MECELDIVPSPFSFLNLSLQLINCVLRLLIDITRATKLGQIIISCFKVFLFAQKVLFKHNLRTLVVTDFSLKFIHYQSFS